MGQSATGLGTSLAQHSDWTKLPDPESDHSLSGIQVAEAIRKNRAPNVRTVLFILSVRGMALDIASLKQKTQFAYPGSEVFFMTPVGKYIGNSAPSSVDLLIDLSGPKTRQGLFFARRLRRRARVAVGRASSAFRKAAYDRVADESFDPSKQDVLVHEREIQRKVLALAGVAVIQAGDTHEDRGKITPMELPPFKKL